ncbi:glutamate receptor 1.1 isoform X2 [Eutrema salsugineum]|uniref:glutamate receptor 1.1 isoform X2 n=1 Tax=Eutrema salsugineum TaxID=72664 RepID=UPI000CECE5A7|nr:glutamate receptor 1.1 isoform X2 [Eutrema salsugineum]
MENLISLLIFILLFSTKIVSRAADRNDCVFEEVTVGLVVDLGSIEGKILEASFSLALSDFYRINNGYRTRVSVLARDTQGDPILALAAATNLLKHAKVEAIVVGAQSLQEAKLLAAVSEKTKVPVISVLVPHSLSLNKYDHFIQLTHDSVSEAKAITSLIHDSNRTSVLVIYEDVDDWRDSLQSLVENFQDEGLHIDRIVSFSESSSRGENHMMNNQLRKLKTADAAVVVVHMSEILVSRLFRLAVKLDRTMQGVIGLRYYIPVSAELEDFTSRLRKLIVDDHEMALVETKHSSARAHDVACILATAIEKMSIRTSANVSDLLDTIRQSRFIGLSHGDIKIVGNEFLSGTFEIVNMVGTGERRIGLWSCDGKRNIMASSTNELETIICPGGSDGFPRHRFLAEDGEKKKLLRVLVPAGNKVPNLMSVRLDPETGVNTVTGFCIEVFKTCIAPFNYQLEFIPYYGNYENLAYLLSTQSDKYDAAVGDITITSNRSSYVDFTLPFTDIGIGILTVKKKSQGMWTFFDPFEKSLWLASGAFFILTGIVVWLVERSVNPEFQGSWGQQLSMMLWFGFSTIVFAHREKLQKMSSRFLVIVWVFVVLILTSSYSANLTSTKTISSIQLNRHAVFASTTIKSMKLGSINAVEAYAQGLRDGTLSHVINEIPYLNLLLGYYPDVFVMTDRETNTNGFGFMFQRGSGLATNVSREIAKLRSLGILKDMEKRWFQKLDSLNVHSNAEDVASLNNDDDASNRFSFRELRGLFIIAGVAHALVLALHLVHIRRQIFTKLQSFL